MNRIDEIFINLRQKKKKAFIAYITAGDPDLKTTEKLVFEMEKAGVDLIELGVPFSDPMADGPVNQRAAGRALAQGVTLRDIVKTVAQIRKKTSVPLILFTYANPVYQYGIDAFSHDAKKAGIDGILLVDVPPEEAQPFQHAFDAHGLHMIYLIAPTSGEKRIKEIVKHAKGFIYLVSRMGVTGTRKDIPSSVHRLIKIIRKYSSLPIAVGFGVSEKKQVESLYNYADAVIVGSAIVKTIERYNRKPDVLKRVSALLKSLIPE